MIKWIVLGVLVARPAFAGLDCDTNGDSDVKRLELFAKDKTKTDEGGLGMICGGNPKFKARIEKACQTIIAREGKASRCYVTAAFAGLTKVGSYDVFAWVMAEKEDPMNWDPGMNFGAVRTELLAAIGDPRSAAAIVEIWKAANVVADDAEKTKKRNVSWTNWSSWRQRSAAALGMVGGQSEIAFLEDQAKATVDKGVSAACGDGIKAIRKRIKP